MPDKIEWSDLYRSQKTRLSLNNELSIYENFTHKFSFKITKIKNTSRSSRLLITLWKLKKSDGNIVSVYIDKYKGSNDKFRLVFFQRVDGKNVFVSVTQELNILKEYRVIIKKEQDVFNIDVLWEEISIFNSDELKGVDQVYNEIVMVQSHGFQAEPDCMISGILFDFNIIEDNLASLSGVPKEIYENIRSLEVQANILMEKSEYDVSKRIYQLIYFTLYEKQSVLGRRIHLGAPLHMIGSINLMQNNHTDAFHYYLLAYMLDVINTNLGNEELAKNNPAYSMLNNFYKTSPILINIIDQAGTLVIERNIPYDPKRSLQELLISNGIEENDLINYYELPNNIRIIKGEGRSYSNIPVSQSGQTVLEQAVNKYGNEIIEKAVLIARNNNRTTVRTDDIEEAISLLKGDQSNDS